MTTMADTWYIDEKITSLAKFVTTPKFNNTMKERGGKQTKALILFSYCSAGLRNKTDNNETLISAEKMGNRLMRITDKYRLEALCDLQKTEGADSLSGSTPTSLYFAFFI